MSVHLRGRESASLARRRLRPPRADTGRATLAGRTRTPANPRAPLRGDVTLQAQPQLRDFSSSIYKILTCAIRQDKSEGAVQVAISRCGCESVQAPFEMRTRV